VQSNAAVGIRQWAIIAIGAVLTACGGGSGAAGGPAPVIESLSASPVWLTAGGSATISWSVSNATSVSLAPLGAQTGTSAHVTPTADTTYVLTATNANGSATAQVTIPVYPPPTVWFAPFPLVAPGDGSIDYLDLFQPGAPWTNAAAHVRVFKVYSAIWISGQYSNEQLNNMVTFLQQNHIALAMEWGPLLPGANGCGAGMDAFDGADALNIAQQIKSVGGVLQYIAFAEPLSGASLYSGTNACQWSPQQVARNAAAQVAQIRSVFPDVVVGDIEPVPDWGDSPDWLDPYLQWVDSWQKVTGTPLAFFHFDTDVNADWRPGDTALRLALAQRGIAYGVIYDGQLGQASDTAWVASAELHFTNRELYGSPPPDHVIFQSWDPNPQYLLPETDPGTLTYLIDRYFRARTELSASLGTAALSGQLSVAGTGAAIPETSVAAMLDPLAGSGQSATYSGSGVVPANTQFITFGIRVNPAECRLPTPAEFSVTTLTIDAGAAGVLSANFQNLGSWTIWNTTASVTQTAANQLSVVAQLGQTLWMNSPQLAFSGAGTAVTFSVSATVPTGSSGGGCAIVAFQDANQDELGRIDLALGPAPVALGSAQSGAGGSFALPLGAMPAGNFELWTTYAGSDSLWPAAAGIAVGTLPPLAIATASLPPATAATPYTQTLSATGGTPPYLWIGSGLPTGLAITSDGMIIGTPSATGTYTVSASAIDESAPTQVVHTTWQLVVN
jgi:hypothetical protein